MNLFIRLLCFSFSFVFAGALFWPMIEQRYFPPEPHVKQMLRVPAPTASKPVVQRPLPRPQAESPPMQTRQSILSNFFSGQLLNSGVEA